MAAPRLITVLRKEPFVLGAYDGRQRAAERVRLAVPADYRNPGRSLEIVFYLLNARRTTANPPVVFLMGGPGIPASVMAPIPAYLTLFDKIAQSASVILLDQRGLGESTPNVDCPVPTQPIPNDLFGSVDRLLAVFEGVYSECAEHWKSRGLTARDFAIEQVADDVESIRRAMGVKQVDLLGFSYGTRVALEVLRRHPRSVRRTVLQGVLGVDKTARIPSIDDRTFRMVASLANEQSRAKGFDPSLEDTLRVVQEQFSRSPHVVSFRSTAGDERRLRVAREAFDAIVAMNLGDRSLPALLNATKNGDSSILSQFVQGLYQNIEKGAGSLMARSIVCSAAAPVAERRRALAEAPASLLGEPFDNHLQSESFCRGLGVISLPAKQPAVRSKEPAMFISGSLDDRTPPANAEDVRRGFSRSQHLIVTNGGHELLTEPEVQDAVVAFLGNQPGPAAIELAKPDYRTIEEAKRRSGRR